MNDSVPVTAQTSKPILGFWVYLMTDCLLFGSLFATYIVLHGDAYAKPMSRELFDLPFVLAETMILLVSSYVCGLANLAFRHGKRGLSLTGLVITILLGLSFLTLEITEFHGLVAEGHNWAENGFLSAFFTLVGTHGAHITVGLMWAIYMVISILRRGRTPTNLKRLTMFSMFWHFLDVIWIFIFTVVYLTGVL